MKRILPVCGGVLFAALLLAANDCLAQASRLAVVEGPLTAECPFGFCPATRRPRTASDFYQLFGYMPASSGVRYPGVPTTPPKNWPKTYWTPKSDQLAKMKHDPLAAYKAETYAASVPRPKPQARPTLPPNKIAPAVPSGSLAKSALAQPPKNASPAKSVKRLTTEDAQEMKRQLGAKQAKLLDDIGRRVANAPDPTRRAELEKTVASVGDHLKNGNVTGRDIADLVGGLKSALPPADQGPALEAAGQLAANEQVKQWLGGNGGTNTGAAIARNNPAGAARPNNPANPGTGGRLGMGNAAGGAGAQGNIPWGAGGWGGNVPIGLIPGLPVGMIIPLPFNQGGGAVLLGMGQPGNRLLLGTGDPDLAAGLLVAPPDALPASDGSGAPVAGDTVLGNAADGPIHYLVNQNSFTIQPQQEQRLLAGTKWIVEFDRGNGRGSAQYQLEQGYYEFRASSDGWELYRKQFSITLDNTGGVVPFNYVVDSRTQTLDVGQKQDLAGIYPPVVQFDNGAGEVKQRRLTADHYRIALDANRTLDLYSADAIPLPAPALPALATLDAPSTPGTSSTVSTPVESGGPESAAPSGLPPGFRLFDITAAIADRAAAGRIPPGFALFDDIAAAQ